MVEFLNMLIINQETLKQITEVKRKNGPEYWTDMRAIIKNDWEQLPKSNFKDFASLLSIPIINRARQTEFLRAVVQYLNVPGIREALAEPEFGNTEESFKTHQVDLSGLLTSHQRILQVGYLAFTNFFTKIKEATNILEIGAGIGDMADIARHLGFKGQYTCFDFPELLDIQKYYHENLGLENVKYVSEVSDLEPAELVIGMFSFTETPLELRNQIYSKICRSNNWLLGFANKIFELDNRKWIEENLIGSYLAYDVKEIPLPFWPWDGGNALLTIHKL